MTELSNEHPAYLFRGAMAEIKRLDTTWRVESDAIKVQYESAVIRRNEAQQEMDRLKVASSERSDESIALRKELAKTAFALVMNTDGLVEERKEALELGIQLETGLWLKDNNMEQLIRSVEQLDHAIKNGEPITHFLNGKLDYVLIPQDGATGINVSSDESGYGYNGSVLSFKIPYSRIARYERSLGWYHSDIIPNKPVTVALDGEFSIKHDLMRIDSRRDYGKGTEKLITYKEALFTRKAYEPKDKDDAYVLGIDGVMATIRALLKPADHAEAEQIDRRAAAFGIWRTVSMITGGIEECDDEFTEAIIDELSAYMKANLWSHTPPTSTPELEPLIASAKRKGRKNAILTRVMDKAGTSVSSAFYNDERVIEAAYDHLTRGIEL